MVLPQWAPPEPAATRRRASPRRAFLAAAGVALAAAEETSPEQAGQPGLTVLAGSERVVSDQWGVRVQGRVRNDSSRPRSGGLEATLLDEGGKVVGTYGALVGETPAGAEVTWTALGGDRPEAWARVDTRVTWQFVHQPKPTPAG